jgi:hypothetical protein
VAARSKVVEETADELYALPLAEFTRTRDERAKALRKAGDRDEADAVKALRKPTVAAWALNQLARRRPKEVKGLVAAGEDLRAAQEELLAGGDRRAFQSAAATERDQVAKLAREAVELAAEDGERASPALTEKIAATLHAARRGDRRGAPSRPPRSRTRGDRRLRRDQRGSPAAQPWGACEAQRTSEGARHRCRRAGWTQGAQGEGRGQRREAGRGRETARRRGAPRAGRAAPAGRGRSHR